MAVIDMKLLIMVNLKNCFNILLRLTADLSNEATICCAYYLSFL